MLPLELQEWLYNEGYDWSEADAVSGGDTSANVVCKHPKAESIFVKYMDSAPPDFFQCEAEGLSYLSSVSNVRTPKVLAYGRSYLALEYIRPNQHVATFWEELGRELALIHEIKRDQSGFINDNYCGRTRQLNTLNSDPWQFFAECRLLPLAERAYDRSLLAVQDLQAIESLCLRLSSLIPDQGACLLHGDLWSGNVHVSEQGLPVLIDPAIYFSWPEIDLAMTTLFGRFDERFYKAYQEVKPLERGWAGRLDLYNLYPLLNHLLLFGSVYLPKVRAVLAEYA
jgi:protein-ribulosamine 3-kinase